MGKNSKVNNDKLKYDRKNKYKELEEKYDKEIFEIENMIDEQHKHDSEELELRNQKESEKSWKTGLKLFKRNLKCKSKKRNRREIITSEHSNLRKSPYNTQKMKKYAGSKKKTDPALVMEDINLSFHTCPSVITLENRYPNQQKEIFRERSKTKTKIYSQSSRNESDSSSIGDYYPMSIRNYNSLDHVMSTEYKNGPIDSPYYAEFKGNGSGKYLSEQNIERTTKGNNKSVITSNIQKLTNADEIDSDYDTVENDQFDHQIIEPKNVKSTLSISMNSRNSNQTSETDSNVSLCLECKLELGMIQDNNELNNATAQCKNVPTSVTDNNMNLVKLSKENTVKKNKYKDISDVSLLNDDYYSCASQSTPKGRIFSNGITNSFNRETICQTNDCNIKGGNFRKGKCRAKPYSTRRMEKSMQREPELYEELNQLKHEYNSKDKINEKMCHGDRNMLYKNEGNIVSSSKIQKGKVKEDVYNENTMYSNKITNQFSTPIDKNEFKNYDQFKCMKNSKDYESSKKECGTQKNCENSFSKMKFATELDRTLKSMINIRKQLKYPDNILYQKELEKYKNCNSKTILNKSNEVIDSDFNAHSTERMLNDELRNYRSLNLRQPHRSEPNSSETIVNNVSEIPRVPNYEIKYDIDMEQLKSKNESTSNHKIKNFSGSEVSQRTCDRFLEELKNKQKLLMNKNKENLTNERTILETATTTYDLEKDVDTNDSHRIRRTDNANKQSNTSKKYQTLQVNNDKSSEDEFRKVYEKILNKNKIILNYNAIIEPYDRLKELSKSVHKIKTKLNEYETVNDTNENDTNEKNLKTNHNEYEINELGLIERMNKMENNVNEPYSNTNNKLYGVNEFSNKKRLYKMEPNLIKNMEMDLSHMKISDSNDNEDFNKNMYDGRESIKDKIKYDRSKSNLKEKLSFNFNRYVGNHRNGYSKPIDENTSILESKYSWKTNETPSYNSVYNINEQCDDEVIKTTNESFVNVIKYINKTNNNVDEDSINEIFKFLYEELDKYFNGQQSMTDTINRLKYLDHSFLYDILNSYDSEEQNFKKRRK